MEEKLVKHVDLLIERYPALGVCKQNIISAYQILEEAYSAGRKLLVAGNGGSASDSEHIVGELMKEFKMKRKIYAAQIDRLMKIDEEMGTVLADHLQGSLPAISLVGEPSLTTAFMNDAVPSLSLHSRSMAWDVLAMYSWVYLLQVTVRMFSMLL